MVANIVGFLSRALTNNNTVQKSTAVTRTSSNPFANPFITSTQNSASYYSASYAKNKPVSGGYFAGYYNGQPNIVGKRLFLEV